MRRSRSSSGSDAACRKAEGHSRATKANAYLSTHNALAAKKSRALTREIAEQAVADAKGVKSYAAAALGISRQALYRLLDGTK